VLYSVCDSQVLSSSAGDADCVDPADRTHGNAGTSAAQNTSSATQEFELPLLQAPLPKPKKIRAGRQENATRQNKMKKSSCLNL
jgi:hypothetical protein